MVVARARNKKVLRQRMWTDEQLIRAGFHYYKPIKRVVMAKMLDDHANIETTLETLTADKGDIMIYTPGDELHDSLDDYDHWPVRVDLFRHTYARWDDMTWQPTPTRNLSWGTAPALLPQAWCLGAQAAYQHLYSVPRKPGASSRPNWTLVSRWLRRQHLPHQ